jgi:kinesin family protein 2/24
MRGKHTIFFGATANLLLPFFLSLTDIGKTFTMMGDRNGTTNGEKAVSNIRNLGLYYMAALDIFHAIQHTPSLDDLYVSISLFEIYGGKLFDLLNSRASVKCLEDSRGQVNFPGLSQHRVESPDALLQLIEVGNAQRSTGTTSRNADSSRSHAVLQIHIFRHKQQQPRRHPQVRSAKLSCSSRNDEEFSRLTFIDLAGSERGVDTASSSRATRLEGAEINTSLLALKEVIRALAVGGSGESALAHVPFRGSKLTQVLKESFVGKNGRSVMIACISPNIGNCEQTLNTLRYADRVKERNAATGEVRRRQPGKGEQQLPPQPSVRNVLPPTTSSKSSQSMNLLQAVEFSRASSSNHSASNTSEVLDDLLASPESGSDIEEFLQDGLDHQQIIDDLVETHKDVVSVMLEMVREEMMLVNAADTNRQSDGGAVLDDSYIAQVQKIQEEQLAMITLLREQLSQYRQSLDQPNLRLRMDNDLQDLLGVALNDSYVEDLRFD